MASQFWVSEYLLILRQFLKDHLFIKGNIAKSTYINGYTRRYLMSSFNNALVRSLSGSYVPNHAADWKIYQKYFFNIYLQHYTIMAKYKVLFRFVNSCCLYYDEAGNCISILKHISGKNLINII